MQVQELPVRRSLQQAMAGAAFEANTQSLGPITVGYPVQDFQVMQFENAQTTQQSQQSITLLLRYAKFSLALILLLTMTAILFDVMNLWFLATIYHLQNNANKTQNTSVPGSERRNIMTYFFLQ